MVNNVCKKFWDDEISFDMSDEEKEWAMRRGDLL